MSGLYPERPDHRPARISRADRKLIEEYERAHEVTRVPPGVSGLPDGPRTRADIRAAEFRISKRARRFCNAARGTPAPEDAAAPAARPAAAAARPAAAADRPDGLAPVPRLKVRIEKPRHIPDWPSACAFEQVAVARLRLRAGGYQRDLGRNSVRRVGRIAAAFDWAKFGALVVRRAGEVFEIVDGQHRAAAAKLRGVRTVPAIVFSGGGAAVFLGLNRDRAQLDAAELYHAELAAGEAEAVALAGILDPLGIAVPRRQTRTGLPAMVTRAVSALRLELRARGADTLGTALRVIALAWPRRPGAFVAETIRGLARVAGEIAAAPDLARPAGDELAALAETLGDLDPADLRAEAKAAAALHGGAAHRHLARIVCNRHADSGGVAIAVGC